MRIVDIIKNIPGEQKEEAFLGLHAVALAAIIYDFTKSGIKIRNIIISKPGFAVAGGVVGFLWYRLLKRFIIEK